MATQITIDGDKVFINNLPLEELLEQVYQKGKQDALLTLQSDKITFTDLQKQLEEKGKKVSTKTLINKARGAGVLVVPIDGKSLAVFKSDVSKFLAI